MRRNGFSLIEVAIVLTVLGLLVGGIIAGKSLIRASAVKSAVVEMQQYRTAVNTFKDQYKALPGDMINATSYWGIAAGSTGNDDTCYSTAATGTATCNGNGDGKITAVGTSNYQYHERFEAWQHLANAGLIQGQFTGVTNSTANNYAVAIGANVPPSKITGGYYDLLTVTGNQGDRDFTDVNYTGLEIAAYSAASAGLFTPAELFQIDTKFDDGKPGYGKIMTYRLTSSIGPNCATGDKASGTSPAQYAVTNKNPVCIMLWLF